MKELSPDRREQIDLLKKSGYSQFVDVLVAADPFTRNGKLNKAKACRLLGTNTNQLQNTLLQCREILDPQNDNFIL